MEAESAGIIECKNKSLECSDCRMEQQIVRTKAKRAGSKWMLQSMFQSWCHSALHTKAVPIREQNHHLGCPLPCHLHRGLS
eukprot:1161539-Pelagomonas_calceolata.AAC.12